MNSPNSQTDDIVVHLEWIFTCFYTCLHGWPPLLHGSRRLLDNLFCCACPGGPGFPLLSCPRGQGYPLQSLRQSSYYGKKCKREARHCDLKSDAPTPGSPKAILPSLPYWRQSACRQAGCIIAMSDLYLCKRN